MRTIRKILLTDYIGAILVGVLIADAFSALIALVGSQISYYARVAGHVPTENGRFSMTYSLLSAVVRVALFLLSAYLLARWLYPSEKANAEGKV